MSEELRWGVLSTADIGRKVVPAMQHATRSRVVAIGSRDLARTRDYASELAIPACSSMRWPTMRVMDRVFALRSRTGGGALLRYKHP